MNPSATLSRLSAAGVVAVIRAPSSNLAVLTADALVAGGVTGLEITYSTPDAALAIAEVARRHGDSVVLGAGTILTVEHVGEARDAGASFLVCPGSNAVLAGAMKESGAVMALGALTPTEVMGATSAGADVVKIFPASLGGPSYLKALRGPFPDVVMMPTGGISLDNLGQWAAAGALAVGAGGDLCPTAAMRQGDWEKITSLARAFRDGWDRAKAALP